MAKASASSQAHLYQNLSSLTDTSLYNLAVYRPTCIRLSKCARCTSYTGHDDRAASFWNGRRGLAPHWSLSVWLRRRGRSWRRAEGERGI